MKKPADMKNKCNFCKKGFSSTNANQRYCSEKCRSANGWEKHKLKKEAKIDVKFFDWNAYKEGVIA